MGKKNRKKTGQNDGRANGLSNIIKANSRKVEVRLAGSGNSSKSLALTEELYNRISVTFHGSTESHYIYVEKSRLHVVLQEHLVSYKKFDWQKSVGTLLALVGMVFSLLFVDDSTLKTVLLTLSLSGFVVALYFLIRDIQLSRKTKIKDDTEFIRSVISDLIARQNEWNKNGDFIPARNNAVEKNIR